MARKHINKLLPYALRPLQATATHLLHSAYKISPSKIFQSTAQTRMASSEQTDIMQALKATINSGPAQHRGDNFYVPKPQDHYHATNDGSWVSSTSTQETTMPPPSHPLNPKLIRLISWNIDVLVPHGDHRMRAALQHLSHLTASSPASSALVIFLQEMSPDDLLQIRSSPWIASHFSITDTSHATWLSPLYGTTALIDRRLPIKRVFRVPWLSKFDRDGLFIDISLTNPQNAEPRNGDKVLRLCNTHLESLVADLPVRPAQLASAATYLNHPDVVAALLAGDLNAIQPFDRTLHSDNGLGDAYLELGGREDSEDGYTWGQQAPAWMREQFGCSRMDKILLRGEVVPRAFERIGVGEKVEEGVRGEVERDIEGAWVTDHYGVMGDFELGEGWEVGVER